jgi:hypothetical protein
MNDLTYYLDKLHEKRVRCAGLEAENERLRAALQRISDLEPTLRAYEWGHRLQEIARRALEGK